MACPTCDHTMQRAGTVFWCPRCGTLIDELHGVEDFPGNKPRLVARASELLKGCVDSSEDPGWKQGMSSEWKAVAESIGEFP